MFQGSGVCQHAGERVLVTILDSHVSHSCLGTLLVGVGHVVDEVAERHAVIRTEIFETLVDRVTDGYRRPASSAVRISGHTYGMPAKDISLNIVPT